MLKLILLLPFLVQSNNGQSIASKVLDYTVIEIEVSKSHEKPAATGLLDMTVREIGLGAETLKGKSLEAQYGIGISQVRLPPGVFINRSHKPIPTGTKMVVVIAKIGTNRQPWIMEAWSNDEAKALEDGVVLIAELKEINEAKTEEEFADRVFYTLKKGNAAADFLWNHLGMGARFSRRETLIALLQRIIECEELPDERRNLIKDTLKRNQPGWAASDERRHELILRITSSEQRKKIVSATMDFSQAIQNQEKAEVAQNWCDNLRGVALEMEERPKGEMAAFIEGVKNVINTDFWSQPFPNHRRLIWKTAFRIAGDSKHPEAKLAWEDMLVEQTAKAKPFVKEEVLARLDDIKDPTFRERLRNAATADPKQVDAAPKKP